MSNSKWPEKQSKAKVAISVEVSDDLAPSLAEWSSKLAAAREMRKAAEELEEVARKELIALIDPLHESYGDKIKAVGWVYQRVQTTRRSVSADLLLNRGIAPDIIRDCTIESKSFSYRVNPVGEKEE